MKVVAPRMGSCMPAWVLGETPWVWTLSHTLQESHRAIATFSWFLNGKDVHYHATCAAQFCVNLTQAIVI